MPEVATAIEPPWSQLLAAQRAYGGQHRLRATDMVFFVLALEECSTVILSGDTV